MDNISISKVVPATQQIGTNPKPSWDKLKPRERDIVIAVFTKGSPEEARKSMDLSIRSYFIYTQTIT